MKILFWFRTHQDDPANTGVVEKCRSIVRAFVHHRFETAALFFSKNGIEYYRNRSKGFLFPNQKHSFRHLLLFYFFADHWLIKNIDFKTYSHFYIRHLPAHPAFIQLLKFAKKQNPALEIILELPTWPYDAEVRGLRGQIVASIDKIYRKRLHRFTDFVLHYGPEKSVWNIPAINLSNGIDWQNIPVRNATPTPEKMLRLIAAGNWNTWHGLDRILAGIQHYHQHGGDFQFHLTIIGDGPVIPDLKKQYNEFDPKLILVFQQPCTGPALDRFFDNSDLGIGVLGLHRKGLTVASPLKHRDYCARGLPFLMAGVDSDFEQHLPFILPVPADDSPVDMLQVIEFVKHIPNDCKAAMRSYAEKNLGWDSKIGIISERYFKAVNPGV